MTGKIEFEDLKHGITASYEIGGVSKKPKDYFNGAIFKNGMKESDIYGNYMGFCDFDGQRYWDIRD